LKLQIQSQYDEQLDANIVFLNDNSFNDEKYLTGRLFFSENFNKNVKRIDEHKLSQIFHKYIYLSNFFKEQHFPNNTINSFYYFLLGKIIYLRKKNNPKDSVYNIINKFLPIINYQKNIIKNFQMIKKNDCDKKDDFYEN
jgi:hypothetical protein